MDAYLKSWAESKGLNDDIVEYKAKELDEYLSQFFSCPTAKPLISVRPAET